MPVQSVNCKTLGFAAGRISNVTASVNVNTTVPVPLSSVFRFVLLPVAFCIAELNNGFAAAFVVEIFVLVEVVVATTFGSELILDPFCPHATSPSASVIPAEMVRG